MRDHARLGQVHGETFRSRQPFGVDLGCAERFAPAPDSGFEQSTGILPLPRGARGRAGASWRAVADLLDHPGVAVRVGEVGEAGVVPAFRVGTVLLMDIAFLPFAAAVLANSFRDGQGERTAVVLHGIAFELAAALFNVIWWYARHGHRMLASSIDPAGVRAISRRFQSAVAWLGTGTLPGAPLPALGAAVISAFIVYHWWPISGEIGHQPRAGRSARTAQRGTGLTSPAKRSPTITLVRPPGKKTW